MKKIFLILSLFFAASFSYAQNVLNIMGKAEEYFYYLEAGKYDSAHLYFSPEQRSKVSPDVLKQIWEGVKEKLGPVKSLETLQSKLQGDYFLVTIAGKFERDDQNFVLAFNKSEDLVGMYMPPKPVAYVLPSYADTTKYNEIATYIGPEGRKLAAVITVPKNIKNFPLVVLVHGSGPSDMDESVGGNKPFKDLALGLAAQGIGTIRYVKRTLLYAQQFSGAFTVKEEVTDDALAAIELAKTVKNADQKQIYVLGHSLGGMLLPQIASLAPTVKGIILAAAPARKLTDIMVEQNKYMFEQMKDTTAAMRAQLDEAIQMLEPSRITQLGGMKPDSVIVGLPASYWVSLNSYDQLATAQKLNKRIFVVQGGNDFQVGKQDFDLWENALNKKKNVAFKFYPALNHLLTLQTEKGNAAQYQVPANVAEELITDLALWIKGQPISK